MTDDLDRIFQALAHAARRQVLDIVRDQPGILIGDLSARFEMSRIAVLKHVNILEAAGLLVSEQKGRTRRLYFNVVPIQQIYDRWTDDYSAAWARGLTRFAETVEEGARRDGRKRKSGL